MSKAIYKIVGMDCPSCAKLIELDLEDAGVKSSCSYAKSTLSIEGDVNEEKIMKIVKNSGYSILPE